MNFKTMTTKELKHEYEIIDEMVSQVGCFNSNDLRLLDSIEAELNKRKIVIGQSYSKPIFVHQLG